MSPFRSCPTTGLQVHRTADQLIKANAIVATVALLVGGGRGPSRPADALGGGPPP